MSLTRLPKEVRLTASCYVYPFLIIKLYHLIYLPISAKFGRGVAIKPQRY